MLRIVSRSAQSLPRICNKHLELLPPRSFSISLIRKMPGPTNTSPYPQPGQIPAQTQIHDAQPGLEHQMTPGPNATQLEGPNGLEEYKGSGKLAGKAAIVTGGDSGASLLLITNIHRFVDTEFEVIDQHPLRLNKQESVALSLSCSQGKVPMSRLCIEKRRRRTLKKPRSSLRVLDVKPCLSWVLLLEIGAKWLHRIITYTCPFAISPPTFPLRRTARRSLTRRLPNSATWTSW